MLTIRPASLNDVPAITDIYNDAVLNTTATFDTEPKTVTEMNEWFLEHGLKYPIIVAEKEGVVSGWASLSQWSPKKAYDTTAETSVYVNPAFHRQGIGRKLIEVITLEGQNKGFLNLFARISEENIVSIHLFESLSYNSIGTMMKAGTKFGRLLNVVMLQRVFS